MMSLQDNVLGELEVPMDELVSNHQYRKICAHVGPAGHDRCLTVGFAYFPGDVDKVLLTMPWRAWAAFNVKQRRESSNLSWAAHA